VAKLRLASGQFSPPCRLVAPSALRAELDRKLRRDLPIPPLLFVESLVRTGFVDGDPHTIYQNLLNFYTSQVLGFYEPQADELVVVNTPAAAHVEGSLVWAHELEHAIQEHRFHLPSRLLAMRSDSDEQRAASAIAEGEAMLVMFLVNAPPHDARALERAEQAVRQQADALRAPVGLPKYFVADLVFPYTTGFECVLRAYRDGGWPAVNQLLRSPPSSTAELLHPDRHRAPGTVAAGELPPTPDGWDEVLTDTVGEWGLAFLLARRLDHAQAATVAAGWDGDRIRVIRDRSDRTRWGFAWRIQARTVEARKAMQSALERELPSLLAHLAPPGPPNLTWVAAGRTTEVRAAWPSPQHPRRSPS